ncbi:MAG: hypothetical protein GY705_14915 [Bacteroidetes bacterium]|nr:hypothetical protein [Bacteroidota bacterium]
MYKYTVRPGYGSEELLIEFSPDKADETFFNCLFGAITKLSLKIMDIHDLWMNDEVLISLDSEKGKFEISKDVWDLVFILSKNNQKIIKKIDDLLGNSIHFKKELVDFKDYR